MKLAVHLIAMVGGLAALSWEVLWQLHASLALGVSARGTAITLAATMAGLTAGSLAMGRHLRDREQPHPLRIYGWLELVIGASGLVMPWGFQGLESLDARLYALSPALAPVAHAMGIVLLLGPATCAMGATLPVFALVARRFETSLAALYAMNPAGAAAGVLLLTFALLPALGVSACVAWVALVNLAAAAACRFIRPSRALRGAAPGPPPAPAAAGAGSFPLALALVFGTGFVTFGLEVAWFRSLRAAFQNTTDSFAYILAAVLIPLAAGARGVPALRRLGVSPAPLLAAAGVAILLATPLVERMDLFPRYARDWGWALPSSRLGLALLTLGPGMLLLGTALPWFLEEHRTPLRCARLYALNTLGAVAGSLVSAWLLLPSFGFARCAWLLGAATVGLALLAGSRRPRWPVAMAGAAALAVAVAASSSPGRDRVHGAGPDAPHRILAFAEGPDSTAAVIEHVRGNRKLVIDGFAASAEGPDTVAYMDWMGRLPMLLHPRPERALVLCLGTGQTAHAVRDMDPSALDVVELNPAVIEMAALFPSNRGVLEDPRVRTIAMDARAWLRRTRLRYDVITLEPMPPHFAGMNALYSEEFYRIAKSRLAAGGLVAQWLPVHLLTPFHAASIAAAFLTVLPDAVLWIEPRSGTGILVGRHGRPPGTPPFLGLAWRRIAGADPAARALRRGLLLDGRALFAFAQGGVGVSDDNQLLAYTRRRGYPGRSPAVLSGANHRLLREVAARFAPPVR